MRWKKKVREEPEHGQQRRVQKFALLPRLVADTWVWLDTYVRVEVYWLTPRMGGEWDLGLETIYPCWKVLRLELPEEGTR